MAIVEVILVAFAMPEGARKEMLAQERELWRGMDEGNRGEKSKVCGVAAAAIRWHSHPYLFGKYARAHSVTTGLMMGENE